MAGNPIDNGYVVVAERHAAFVRDHPRGVVNNKVEAFEYDAASQQGFVSMRSEVWKERESAVKGEPPDGVGNASMPIPGPTAFTKNSEVENAETSALGRALAMIGYHPKETLASQDEIKAKSEKPADTPEQPAQIAPDSTPKLATKAQRDKVFAKGNAAGLTKDELKVLRERVTDKRSSTQFTNADVDAMLAAIEEAGKAKAATGGEIV